MALVVLCLCLASLVCLEWQAGLGWPAARAPDAAAAPGLPDLATPDFTPPGSEQFSEIVARPLFSRSRRPWIAAPEAPMQRAQQRPAQRVADDALTGVLIAPAGRIALLQPGDGRVDRLAEGQDVAGWTVQRIVADRVILRRGDARQEIVLRDDLTADPPPRAAPARRAGRPAPQLEQAQVAAIEPVSAEMRRAIEAVAGR